MSADSVVWLPEHSLFAVLNSHFWCWDCDSYLLKEANQAIFFSNVLHFFMPLCASVYLCLVVTCWEKADLLALVRGVLL